MELQERLGELQAQGLGVAAISYDSQEVLAAFAQRKGVEDVPLLSDDDSSAIRAFGIYNHVAEEGIGPNKDDEDVKADVAQYVSVFGANPMIVGTPFPGTFVVDREGRVTSRFFEEFYRERNTAANIMLKLGTPLSGISGPPAKRRTWRFPRRRAIPTSPSAAASTSRWTSRPRRTCTSTHRAPPRWATG